MVGVHIDKEVEQEGLNLCCIVGVVAAESSNFSHNGKQVVEQLDGIEHEIHVELDYVVELGLAVHFEGAAYFMKKDAVGLDDVFIQPFVFGGHLEV